MNKKMFNQRTKKGEKEEGRSAVPIDPSALINWLLRWLLELTLKDVLKKVMFKTFDSMRKFASSIVRRVHDYMTEEIDYEAKWGIYPSATDYVSAVQVYLDNERTHAFPIHTPFPDTTLQQPGLLLRF